MQLVVRNFEGRFLKHLNELPIHAVYVHKDAISFVPSYLRRFPIRYYKISKSHKHQPLKLHNNKVDYAHKLLLEIVRSVLTFEIDKLMTELDFRIIGQRCIQMRIDRLQRL